MTYRAVRWADHDVHLILVVVEGIGMSFGPQKMALGTANDHSLQFRRDLLAGYSEGKSLDLSGLTRGDPRMSARPPAAHDPGMEDLVAHQARLGSLADRLGFGCTRGGKKDRGG
jgi:hypothetical protein